jgi:hypothetical protein
MVSKEELNKQTVAQLRAQITEHGGEAKRGQKKAELVDALFALLQSVRVRLH